MVAMLEYVYGMHDNFIFPGIPNTNKRTTLKVDAQLIYVLFFFILLRLGNAPCDYMYICCLIQLKSHYFHYSSLKRN